MNKFLIVLLAVCLVSVNSAVVKRETENTSPNYIDDVSKKLQEALDNTKNELSKAFDPEKIKKSFSEGIDTVNKWVNDLQKQQQQQEVKQ